MLIAHVMISYRSRLFRPSGGAARARRISADGRSALRASPEKLNRKCRKKHEKDRRMAWRGSD